MKIIYLLGTLIFSYNIFAQDSIIVKNSEHVIYYRVSENSLTFYIEDLKDNEDNFSLIPKHYNELVTPGTAVSCDNSKPTRDMVFIEIDKNQNGIVDMHVDMSYTIPYNDIENNRWNWQLNEPSLGKHYSNVQPYYMTENMLGRDAEINKRSRALGIGKWEVSQYKQTPHLVWFFDIPWNELVSWNNAKLFLRFKVQRVSNYWGSDKYGTFYYPEENSCNNNGFYSYKFDFSSYPKIKEKKVSYETKKTFRVNNSKEIIKKSTAIKPEWDGVYVQLNNGKYIEIKAIPLKIAGFSVIKQGTISPTLDYLYEAIEKRQYYFSIDDIIINPLVLQIKKAEMKGILFVSSNFQPSSISQVSLSTYELYKLKPDGTEILSPLNFSENYKLSDFLNYTILRDSVFLKKELIQTKRLSLPNSTYLFVPSIISKGIYSFWFEGKNSFVFELVE